MKKLFLGIIVAGILTLTSCSNGTSSLLGGTWSYNSISYSAISAIGSTTAGTLTATTGSTSEVDNVVFRFASFPPPAGSYTVTNNPSPATGEVYVITNIGTKAYTLDNSSSATATVTVSGTKVSVVVPTVTFSNITGQATASGPFTASISQNL